jgi:hypothetical protein
LHRGNEFSNQVGDVIKIYGQSPRNCNDSIVSGDSNKWIATVIPVTDWDDDSSKLKRVPGTYATGACMEASLPVTDTEKELNVSGEIYTPKIPESVDFEKIKSDLSKKVTIFPTELECEFDYRDNIHGKMFEGLTFVFESVDFSVPIHKKNGSYSGMFTDDTNGFEVTAHGRNSTELEVIFRFTGLDGEPTQRIYKGSPGFLKSSLSFFDRRRVNVHPDIREVDFSPELANDGKVRVFYHSEKRNGRPQPHILNIGEIKKVPNGPYPEWAHQFFQCRIHWGTNVEK